MATQEIPDRIKVGKLIIGREDLKLIQALARAKAEENRQLALPEGSQPIDPLAGLPPGVRRFWLRDEQPPPSWRLESAEQRIEREAMERLGGWAG